MPRHPILTALRQFIRLEAFGGLVLIAAAALALMVANGPLADAYFSAKAAYIGPLTLDYWINDGLMAIFFLLIGLEVKREFLAGELSSMQERVLPGIAAVSGVILPAAIYIMIVSGDRALVRGWAIPTATDIAFALGVLALLGKRVPASLKIFLTAVAVIDDLIAVMVIALFYTDSVNIAMLGAAFAGLAVLVVLNRMRVHRVLPYLLIGALVWLAVLKSGVHATLAGVALGFTIPLGDVENGHNSPLVQLEHALHPWVAYLIIPIFGFFNAGVALGGISLETLRHPLPLGIAAGLLIGKLVGIFAATWLAVRLGIARLPYGARWGHMLGISLLCGIGFTMSLFIGGLAFHSQEAGNLLRLGVLGGSTLAALAGVAVLRLTGPGGPAPVNAVTLMQSPD